MSCMASFIDSKLQLSYLGSPNTTCTSVVSDVLLFIGVETCQISRFYKPSWLWSLCHSKPCYYIHVYTQYYTFRNMMDNSLHYSVPVFSSFLPKQLVSILKLSHIRTSALKVWCKIQLCSLKCKSI